MRHVVLRLLNPFTRTQQPVKRSCSGEASVMQPLWRIRTACCGRRPWTAALFFAALGLHVHMTSAQLLLGNQRVPVATVAEKSKALRQGSLLRRCSVVTVAPACLPSPLIPNNVLAVAQPQTDELSCSCASASAPWASPAACPATKRAGLSPALSGRGSGSPAAASCRSHTPSAAAPACPTSYRPTQAVAWPMAPGHGRC